MYPPGTARSFLRAAEILGGRPAGCPCRYRGCGVSLKVFGRTIPDLNLAANWKRFAAAMPEPGPSHGGRDTSSTSKPTSVAIRFRFTIRIAAAGKSDGTSETLRAITSLTRRFHSIGWRADGLLDEPRTSRLCRNASGWPQPT